MKKRKQQQQKYNINAGDATKKTIIILEIKIKK